MGTLVGVMLLNPVFAVLGFAAGTFAGAVSGSIMDIGVDEEFIEDLAEHLKPSTSALFALAKAEAAGKVFAKLKKSGGRVFQTSLSHTDQTKLQAALDEVARNVGTLGHSRPEDKNRRQTKAWMKTG